MNPLTTRFLSLCQSHRIDKPACQPNPSARACSRLSRIEPAEKTKRQHRPSENKKIPRRWAVRIKQHHYILHGRHDFGHAVFCRSSLMKRNPIP
jgi:hypothetical protein